MKNIENGLKIKTERRGKKGCMLLQKTKTEIKADIIMEVSFQIWFIIPIASLWYNLINI